MKAFNKKLVTQFYRLYLLKYFFIYEKEIYRPDLKFTDEQYNFTDEHQKSGGCYTPTPPR